MHIPAPNPNLFASESIPTFVWPIGVDLKVSVAALACLLIIVYRSCSLFGGGGIFQFC
jgi:hypothetical protein